MVVQNYSSVEDAAPAPEPAHASSWNRKTIALALASVAVVAVVALAPPRAFKYTPQLDACDVPHCKVCAPGGSQCLTCDDGYEGLTDRTDHYAYCKVTRDSCPAGSTPDFSANECKWNECTCDHGTPFNGKTIHEQVFCGYYVDQNHCPVTECDQGRHVCHNCDQGYGVVGYPVVELDDGWEKKCVECSYDDLHDDRRPLHDQCKCLQNGHWCQSDSHCCGDNVCHGLNGLQKLFGHHECQPSDYCVPKDGDCSHSELFSCCHGLVCWQPDARCGDP